MSVLIEDSPRNLILWITDAINRGLARGAVLTPWASPAEGKAHRRSASDHAEEIIAAGGELWFDPTTHALQMAGVGDFRYYDEYDLWTGPRGDLTTPGNRAEHLRKVFELQAELGAHPLAPTILLHHGESERSQHALDLATEAIEQNPDCWLSIAGTSPFWESEAALDSHIGALAQLEPKGWFLTVARPLSSLPVDAHPEEVHGLCRTVRALSEYAQVHISHGDIAGLPGVAAGAFSIGTGWDQRQRVCAFSSYAARSEGGGGWYQRPTFPGLLGSLKRPEAELLERLDAIRAGRLGPVPPPGPQEAFRHHLDVLRGLMRTIAAGGSYEGRYRALAASYASAAGEWPDVCRLTSCDLNEDDWITDLRAGLEAYTRAEGW